MKLSFDILAMLKSQVMLEYAPAKRHAVKRFCAVSADLKLTKKEKNHDTLQRVG